MKGGGDRLRRRRQLDEKKNGDGEVMGVGGMMWWSVLFWNLVHWPRTISFQHTHTHTHIALSPLPS